MPIIGITTHNRNAAGEIMLPGAYVDAIYSAGGTPILLPPTQSDLEALLEILDGLVFSGGGDISPLLYRGEEHPMIYGVDEERDRFEFMLAKLALSTNIPVLGICRGMQMLNIVTGGDLIPHVPDVFEDLVNHRLDNPRRPIPHDLSVLPDSKLANVIDTTQLHIVSWHHQAVKTVPSEWRVCARAEDGLIEAIEHTTHPWMIAVQWHPEMSRDDPAHRRLFQAFVAACSKKRRS